jgi:hypothetical protein
MNATITTTVTLCHETTSGETSDFVLVDFLDEVTTPRELIRRWVYEAARERNQQPTCPFGNRVQPSEMETLLNGYDDSLPLTRQPAKIDWEQAYAEAITAFTHSRYFVLVDDRQVTNLDEDVYLKMDTRVSFLKLVPLVGG